MPKRTIRLPALTPGRRLRWTIEVTADDGATPESKPKGGRRKHPEARRAAPAKRDAPTESEWAPAAPHAPLTAESTSPVAESGGASASLPPTAAPSHVAAPSQAALPSSARAPSSGRRHTTVARPALAIAGVAAVIVVAALAYPRRPTAPISMPVGQTAAAHNPVSGVELPPQPVAAPVSQVLANAATSVASAPSSPREEAATPPLIDGSAPVRSAPARSSARRAPRAASVSTVAPVTATTTPEETADRENGATAVVAPEPSQPAPPPTSAATSAATTSPVTITGCLEISVDHEDFRLTDTDGTAAPKARSWRSGFLRKRLAPVALVAPPDPLQMKAHVGRRVAARGWLEGHELRVSSVHVVDGSCQ